MESKIKWQTGEPKEGGSYLTTVSNGTVLCNVWAKYAKEWVFWKNDVTAWCKLSDIEPYKEEKEMIHEDKELL